LKDYQDKSTDTTDDEVAENVGKTESPCGQAITSDKNNADVGFQAYAKENADTSLNGTWGPSLPKRMEKTIPFSPEFTIFLGSPIGLFLTLRGAHPVFNELREKSILEIAEKCEKSLTSITESASGESDGNDKKKDPMDTPEIPYASPFKLPSGAIYNVYSASDPVAYRIEPLLLPPEMNPDNFPPAVHLTAEGQSVRLHVKAQQLGDEIGKFFEGKKGGLGTFLTQAVSALGKAEDETSQRSIGPNVTGPQTFALAGNAKRLDYQLQRGVVENEYLSAVTAHSNYFVNTDFQDFLMSLTAKYDVTLEQNKGGDII
jgi:hypothetical protein